MIFLLIVLLQAATIVGLAVILGKLDTHTKRQIRTLAGIQKRLTHERKRDYKK